MGFLILSSSVAYYIVCVLHLYSTLTIKIKFHLNKFLTVILGTEFKTKKLDDR